MTSLAELDEIVFGATSGRGRPKKQVLEVEVIRELEDEDCEAIAGGRALEPMPPAGSQITRLRHSHHQVAMLLAQGQSPTEISLITGYHPQYIYGLSQGNDFKELIHFYSTERKRVFDETLERMKALGIASLEKLHELLEDSNEKWSKRELMEMAELMLVKPQMVRQGGGGNANGSPVTVNVKFVTAEAPAAGPVIEGEAMEVA
jgi:hypothetical protein